MRRSLFLCLISFFYLFPLHAKVQEEDLNRAYSYFEAGDYRQAKAEYEGLLEGGIDSSEKQILTYNIATALLAAGKWQRAISRFQLLVDEEISLPLLKLRVLSNLALARIEEIEVRLETLNKNVKASHEDYDQVYALFRRANGDLDNAFLAWCALKALEGATSCPPAMDLEEMRLILKEKMSEFFKRNLKYHLEHLSVPDAVSELLFGIRSLSSQLIFLQEQRVPKEIQAKYLEDYLDQAVSWKVLWESLANSLELNSKTFASRQYKKMVDLSHNMFLDSIALAGQGNFHDSFLRLESSKAALNTLLKQFFNELPLKEALRQLLVNYDLALIKDPLQEAYLAQVLEVQTAIGGMAKNGIDPSFFGDYEKAEKYLELSLHFFRDFQLLSARLFAEIARFYVKNSVEQTDFATQTPLSVLENAIAKQEFILLLNDLRRQVKGDKTSFSEIASLMPSLQQLTLKMADRFLGLVLKQQEEAFNSTDNRKSRCQCHPWDEVIPLFSEGYMAANVAQKYLEDKHFSLSSIELLQKSTVDYWKKALEKMKAPYDSSLQDASKSYENPLQEQSKKTIQPEVELKQDDKLNDSVRLIQEMEAEDRSKPQQLKTSSGATKGEERPW